MSYKTYTTQRENQRLHLASILYDLEHRLYKDEIKEWEQKPTYDQGYKDAIIRVGGPQSPSAYQDGWDDAMRVIGTQSNYADGYHAAVQQFGYSKTQLCRWLVPVPEHRGSGKGYEHNGKPTEENASTVSIKVTTEGKEEQKQAE
jgi:hypothetical protein